MLFRSDGVGTTALTNVRSDMKSHRQSERWHVRRRRQRAVFERDGVAVVSLGEANVWDYGDLVRLRQAVSQLISQGHRRIGVELAHVGCLPSGFMNMLCEWQELGMDVYLFGAQPNVRRMLWFRRFTEPVGNDAVRITCTTEAMREELEYDRDGSGDEIPAWADSRH